jgi:hypothetical protein
MKIYQGLFLHYESQDESNVYFLAITLIKEHILVVFEQALPYNLLTIKSYINEFYLSNVQSLQMQVLIFCINLLNHKHMGNY